MFIQSRRCIAVGISALFLTLLVSVVPQRALASHESIVVDGDLTDLINAINNNLGPDKGGFTAPDPLGDTYTQTCAYVNGYDIRQAHVLIDFKDAMGHVTPNDITLYAGWEQEGIVGDVDGDGNADNFDLGSPGGSNGCAISDEPGIGPNESYNVILNLDCTGAPDDVRIQIKNNQVSRVVGGVITPLPTATFMKLGNKLELKVPHYETLLQGLQVTTDLCDAQIRLTANAEFDGPGEDIAPIMQLALLPSVDVTKTPPTQQICAGAPVSWTITVTNDGLCVLTDVSVSDVLGAGLDFDSSTPPPSSQLGQDVNWTYTGINLGPGGQIQITLHATSEKPCASPTLTNNVSVEAVHLSPCNPVGVPPPTATDNASATVSCRDLPPCNITGDTATCVGNTKTFSTTVTSPFGRQWVVSSVPPGICNTASPLDGASISVNFTGEGTCKVQLIVTDPLNPEACADTCDHEIIVHPQPPCDISGDLHTCFPMSETYTTTVGAPYTRLWSATSTPPGICNISGPTDGASVTVNFTAAGQCTVMLHVTDPNDPTDCVHDCTQIITVDPMPPCDIAGDFSVCLQDPKSTSQTYTTTVGAPYTRLWSATSTPPGICNISGPTNGGSVTVNFTAAGQCTLMLHVTDPNDPTDCMHDCSQVIVVTPTPPCDISGDDHTCFPMSETYTTTVGAEFNRTWSATSTPPGICNISGPTNGGSVTVNFTAAGQCTVMLSVADPNEPETCNTPCTKIVDVDPMPPCDISGDLHTCFPMSETYTTTVGAPYTRLWSATSTPPGICNISGPTDGASVTVNFTAAGQCTLKLHVTDPNDPTDCVHDCTQIVTVDPMPPCDIGGDFSVCLQDPKSTSQSYTTTVGAAYTKLWSATSTPAGICSISGPTNGSSVTVNFTGAGQCTLMLHVTDPNDPTDCVHDCSQVIVITPTPPCDISGDDHTCFPMSETYTTTVGAEFTRTWSATSTPPGICNISGPTNGGSVTVNFTAAGQCTVMLSVADPSQPEACNTPCTKIVDVDPMPPCDISGDLSVCLQTGASRTYTTTVGAAYTKLWSATSTPAGICSISGPTNGASVTVNFTGAGQCTLKLHVTDPNDPTDCVHECTETIVITPTPPCDISGDDHTCFPMSETYTTTVGAGFTRTWSATSTPPGICNISGPTNGSSVTVNFTAAGQCTVMLSVADPNEPETCNTPCTKIVDVSAPPPCDISGDLHTCFPASETYTTTVGAGYTKLWSATSTPHGICNISGPTNGASVTVNFTGAGQCTLKLHVTDPNDPTDCVHDCTQIITIDALPNCTISGPGNACVDSTVTFTVSGGPGLTQSWSATSNPPGICNIMGPTNGTSVAVNFTGAGTCTLSVVVSAADSPDCTRTCTFVVTVDVCVPPRESCWMTGGGCLNEPDHKGHKDHTFGGNVGPPPSCSWEDVVRDGKTILFNFHSWDAHIDSCWHDNGPGPCSPKVDVNNIAWSGTGKYSLGAGSREVDCTFMAHVGDHGEPGNHDGPCGSNDFYELTVFDPKGKIAFRAEGYLSCGNLQLHPDKKGTSLAPIDDWRREIETETGFNFGDELLTTRPFPNPVLANSASIEYRIPAHVSSAEVRIIIFDVTGRAVRTLNPGVQSTGSYSADWDLRDEDGSQVPSGIYFYRLTVGNESITNKLMVVRN